MKIILCEGKTDAILISYYIIQTFGYLYAPHCNRILPIEENQHLDWYTNGENGDVIAIWSVGGYGNLKKALKDVIQRNSLEKKKEDRFSRIVLFYDRDTSTDKELETALEGWINDCEVGDCGPIEIQKWISCENRLRKDPPSQFPIEIMAIVLPPDKNGALETFLLDSLCNIGDCEQIIVDGARNYVNGIPEDPYLVKGRYKEKASLGSVLSVMSPDWVFSQVNEKLLKIRWERLTTFNAVYSKLSEIIN